MAEVSRVEIPRLGSSSFPRIAESVLRGARLLVVVGEGELDVELAAVDTTLTWRGNPASSIESDPEKPSGRTASPWAAVSSVPLPATFWLVSWMWKAEVWSNVALARWSMVAAEGPEWPPQAATTAASPVRAARCRRLMIDPSFSIRSPSAAEYDRRRSYRGRPCPPPTATAIPSSAW